MYKPPRARGRESFIRGIARLIDFGGAFRDPDGRYRDGAASDARMMGRDWKNAVYRVLRYVGQAAR